MSNRLIKILFLAANPSDETRLRLGAESTRIKEALEAASTREQFTFSEEHAVRLDSIQRLILKQNPTIVHFSGHGSPNGTLVFEDQSGKGVEADSKAIAELFKLAGENTRLIVLNACYSESQATALAQHVDAVIGMDSAIPDETAIAFAKSLYETLGERRNVKTAFELAKNYLVLQGLSGAELPVLVERAGVPAASVLLLPPR
ncbi:CHAT domain-containing protein [Bradyrhizobium sp.]|jgi:hypothetical protein|uniref:CHAT domain-containing protein n=1 Tax=Bradyrhizobium sp. TaxID=376 RepID=UPI002E0CDA9F|nr:CHAT domain-containing protein [Bradyrhizobium sp.]